MMLAQSTQSLRQAHTHRHLYIIISYIFILNCKMKQRATNKAEVKSKQANKAKRKTEEEEEIGLFNNITNIVLIVIQNRCHSCLAAKNQAIFKFKHAFFVQKHFVANNESAGTQYKSDAHRVPGLPFRSLQQPMCLTI